MEQRVSVTRRTYWTTDDIRNRIAQADVVVFGRGTSEKPQCGFSERVYSILREGGKDFDEVNVCSDNSIQAALSTFAGTPELPLVYVKGSMFNCSDASMHRVDFEQLQSKVQKN